MQAFLSQWQHWLPPLLVGAILTHLWARFRARMTVIRYQIHHLYLAVAQNSPIFGNLRVLLNEVEYHNLYFSTITFANDTARDFKDLDINIAAMPRTEILGAYGKTASSVNYLAFTDAFNAHVNEAKKGNQTALDLVRTRRDFRVPVMNRGDNILITLLTTHLDAQQPALQVACDHFGVRLKLAPAVEQFWGEPRDRSAFLGLAIAFLLCWPVLVLVQGKVAAVLLAAFLGAICLLFGVAARKVFRWFVRLGS